MAGSGVCASCGAVQRDRPAEWGSDRPPPVRLSAREQEILALYAAGEKSRRVASRTGLAVSTVREYVDRIRVKYDQAGRPAPTKIDLYHRAVEDGILHAPQQGRLGHVHPDEICA